MVKKRFVYFITAFFITTTFLVSKALAESNSTSKPAYGALWGPIILGYFTRKLMIGGLLLLYYCQVYGGSFFSILMIVLSWQDYLPAGWENKGLYGLFIISTIPSLLILILEAIIASLLLQKRNRNSYYVNFIKIILITAACVDGLSALIDAMYFPDNFGLNLMVGIVNLLWFYYFKYSKRVFYVFLNPSWNWDYEFFKNIKAINTDQVGSSASEKFSESPITKSAPYISKAIPTSEKRQPSTYEREKVKALLRDTPNKSVNEKEPFNLKNESPPFSSSQKEDLLHPYKDFLIDIPKRSIQNSRDSSEVQFRQNEELSDQKSVKKNKGISVEEQERMKSLYRESYEKIYGKIEEELDMGEEPESQKAYRHIPSKVKNDVWNQDQMKCVKCGSQTNLHFDHIIPFSRGGGNTLKNIQILCSVCNLKKSNKIQ
jgi:hypothetical protein